MATSATELKETDYAHPEVLVDTKWVADHLNDPKVKIIEVRRAGLIPSAIARLISVSICLGE